MATLASSPRDYHVDTVITETVQQPAQVVYTGRNEQAELDAYEKGRMAGEMEAIRRMEAERGVGMGAGAAIKDVPDVVEINRLTWMQRLSAALSLLTALCYPILAGVWLDRDRGGFSMDSDEFVQTFNTHILTFTLGCTFVTLAYLLYRILPIRTPPIINRLLYYFNIAAALTCFSISIWAAYESVDNGLAGPTNSMIWSTWAYISLAAFGMFALHAIYSVLRSLVDWMLPIHAHEWNETPVESEHGHKWWQFWKTGGRHHPAVYTPAPHRVPMAAPTSANVGAEVPAAPGNAPRWAETPRTHANDFWLLPKAKWAAASYALLMSSLIAELCVWESNMYYQDRVAGSPIVGGPGNEGDVDFTGVDRDVLIALIVIPFASLFFTLHAIQPPRTTLVKNGILTEPARRGSMSYGAPTRLGDEHIV